ncbi:MAG: hypothetical protein VB118_04280 [Oscillospiraceae bacterium]|nr:hypothetical protein [Oscillospiraceae bacterium]
MSASEITIAFRCGACGMTTIEKLNIFELSGGRKIFKCDCGQSTLAIETASDNKLRITAPCIVCENPHRFTVAPSLVFGKELFLLQCPYTGVDVVFVGEKKQVEKALDISDKLLQTLIDENFDDGLSTEDEADDIDGDEDGDEDGDDNDYENEDEDDLDFDDDAFDDECEKRRGSLNEQKNGIGENHNCNCNHDFNNNNNREAGEIKAEEGKKPKAPHDISECDNPVITGEVMYLLRDMVTDGALRCSCGGKKLAIGIGYDSLVISCPSCGRMKKLFTRSESDRAKVEELDSLTLE